MKSNPYHFPITRCPNCGCDTIVIKQYICGYGEYRVNMITTRGSRIIKRVS